MSTSAPASFRDRWSTLGGDRFYTLIRLLVVGLLFGLTLLLPIGSLWPIGLASDPAVLALWAYAAFALLASIALVLPLLSSLLKFGYLFDVAFLALLVFLIGEAPVIFYPLFLLPLVSAALRMSQKASFFAGLFAAACYGVAFVGWRRLIDPGLTPLSTLDNVSLALRCSSLLILPLLTSILAGRWSQNNRDVVVVAQQQSEDAVRETQAYRDNMRSLYDVAYALSTTMDYNEVLNAMLRESRKLVPYSVGLVLLSTGTPDELYVAAGLSSFPSDDQRRIVIGRGSLTQLLRAPDPRLLADISQELDLRTIESLRLCRAACLIPLRAALRTYGVAIYASDHPNAFAGEQLDMLTALANYGIIALHNAHLLEDLKQERNKLISKEEEVRHQLARDLHDGPAQALAAITMNIEFIKRLLLRDPERVIEELDKLSNLAKRTTYEVRTLLFELRPLVLETQGLKVTLEQYLERFKQDTGETKIILETNGVDDVVLETKTEATLFNIIQEAINNGLKHARAKHIWVRLNRNGSMIETVIKDDGVGFDKKKLMKTYEKRGSFGLLNIDERARLVGGYSETDSVPGQGTTVKIVVPIEHQT
ncbi:MAG: GAF domain-containing sensor histidine kinase [Chloroflexaceae bacterium]|nr:GAF domain-containing sensor histidine kinase [Chloroflexaceae bacterium]